MELKFGFAWLLNKTGFLFSFLGLQLQSLSGTIPGKHYSSFSISGAGCCKGGHEQDTSSCIELFLAAVLSVFRVTVKTEAAVLASEKVRGKASAPGRI